jgi:hypothetical protein
MFIANIFVFYCQKYIKLFFYFKHTELRIAIQEFIHLFQRQLSRVGLSSNRKFLFLQIIGNNYPPVNLVSGDICVSFQVEQEQPNVQMTITFHI